MTVTAADRGYFDVTSQADETRSYMVLPRKSCTCPHHQCRGAYCKHLQAVDSHIASQPAPTALQKAATVAQTLSDAELKKYASERLGTPAGAACLLTLAARAATAQPKPIPAGVECFLVGATEAEKARALACYGS